MTIALYWDFLYPSSIEEYSPDTQHEKLERLRDTHHFDEILRLVSVHGARVNLDGGALEFAAELEEAAIAAGKEDQQVAAAIAKRCREILAEFQ